MDYWKAIPQDNVILKISNGAPNKEQKYVLMWPDNDLFILCYFLAAIPSLKIS